MLPGTAELALQQLFEPAPVVEARERVGVCAAALAIERHRRVERAAVCAARSDASSPWPRSNSRAKRLAPTSRPISSPFARSGISTTDRSFRPVSSGTDTAVVSSSSNTADASMRARSARSESSVKGSGPWAVALHSVDSTSCPSSSSSSSWLSRPAALGQRAHRHLRDRLWVAERAHVDEEASER